MRPFDFATGLRAAGIEVWFDQNELVGGDAWDQKIRRQIKDCALFVPVISAATQARTEGYFRLEWRLADQRTHLMAKGRPFLLPVVIDDTCDADAHVPDSFTEVQWTRLPGGETSAAFCQRVSKLLGGSQVGPVALGSVVLATEAHRAPGQRPGLQPKPSSSRPWLIPAVAGLAMIAALALWQPWKKGELPETKSSAPSALSLSNGLSEARQLVARGRVLMENPNAVSADYAAAAGLFEQAAQIAPNDVVVWAAWAEVDSRYVAMAFDDSPQRIESARKRAAQALGLDPNNRDAKFAQAFFLTQLEDTPAVLPQAETLLRSILAADAGDGRALMGMGNVVAAQGRIEEAVSWFDRAAQQPGLKAEACHAKSVQLFFASRYTEAEAALQQSLDSGRIWQALTHKANLAMQWRGDYEAATQAIAELPPAILLEDIPATLATAVYLAARDPERVLKVLRAVPREFLGGYFSRGPKGYWMGEALALAGRPEAAATEWRAAQRVIEQQLVAASRDTGLMLWKAALQTKLDDREGATRTWKLYLEFVGGTPSASDARRLAMVLRIYFDHDDALKSIAQLVDNPPRGFTAAALRHYRMYDPLRSHPRFQALLARADADPRMSPAAAAATRPAPATMNKEPVAKSIAVLAFTNLWSKFE